MRLIKKTIILLIVLFVLFQLFEYKNEITNFIGISSFAVWEKQEIQPEEIAAPIEVYFCPQDRCMEKLVAKITEANKSIYCALYNLNSKSVVNALAMQHNQGIDVRVVVDDQNYRNVENIQFIKKDNSQQLSHNKFCVFDSRIILTGSFNPTEKGLGNNDNLVIIHSIYLAKNYGDEFSELWKGVFGSGKKVKYPVVIFNNKKIGNYFCPEDNCESQVLAALHKANQSIYFMTFAFTSDKIGNFLMANKDKLDIQGLFEGYKLSRWSEYHKMKKAGMNVKLDRNSNYMHHKVFIIDGKTVILGSYNPTKLADTKNDENILIINDEEIAKQFIEEFNRLF